MLNQNLHKNLHSQKMALEWLIYNISKRSTDEWGGKKYFPSLSFYSSILYKMENGIFHKNL